MTSFNVVSNDCRYTQMTYIRPGLADLVTVYSVLNAPFTVGQDVKTGTSNRDWKQQIALGVNAATDYSRIGVTKYVRPSIRGVSYGPVPGGFRRCVANYNYHPNLLAGFRSDVDDIATRELALARLKRKLQSHYGNMQALTPLAELRETRRCVLSSANLATGLMEKLLSLRKNKPRDLLRYASDAWLNFQFGVSPLIRETAQAVQSVDDYLQRKNHSTRLVGGADKSWISGGAGAPNSAAGLYGNPLQDHVNAQHTISYRYIGGFDFQVESGNNYGVNDHFGLEFKELIPTFWELVPYSWVVDYFTSVGSYLDDTFEIPAGSLKYLVLNRKYTYEAQLYQRYLDVGSTVRLQTMSAHPGALNSFSFSRTRLTTLPRKALRFKSRDEIGLFAVNKLLNLTALLLK